MTDTTEPNNSSEDLDFLMGHVELVDEEIKQWINDNPNKEKALLEDNSVKSNRYKQISHQDLVNRQKLLHEKEEHALRKQHLGFLSKITVYWLGLITAVSLLQGFGGILPFEIILNEVERAKLPFTLEHKKFVLSDTSYIALITTTTATILGLYTIAAIWLYKGKQEDKEQKANTENSSEE